MNVPRGPSYPAPGYLSSVPPKPPDMSTSYPPVDIKGEYIEECDEIKEESDRQTPAPASPAPFYPSHMSYRGGLPTFNSMPRLTPLHHSNLPQLATMSPGLTPLQLIHKLSTYASHNRKRTMQQPEVTTQLSPPKKAVPVFTTPKIDKVVSLHQPAPVTKKSCEVSPNKLGGETNNNDKDDTDVGDLTNAAGAKSMIDCPVCGDIAVAHFHYGGMCCYSCKAFFRRVVNTNKVNYLISYKHHYCF